jgi:hypothetical protein
MRRVRGIDGWAPAGREEAPERIKVDAVTVGGVRDKRLHAVECAARALMHLSNVA